MHRSARSDIRLRESGDASIRVWCARSLCRLRCAAIAALGQHHTSSSRAPAGPSATRTEVPCCQSCRRRPRASCSWLLALSAVAVVLLLTLCRPTLGCFFLPTHIPPIPTIPPRYPTHDLTTFCLEPSTLPSTASTGHRLALPHAASPVFTYRPLGTSPANQYPFQIPRERSTSSILGRLRPRPKYNTIQYIASNQHERIWRRS